MKKKDIYFEPLYNEKYGVFAKADGLKPKLVLVCNRAFNADVIAHILEADQNQECFKLNEMEKV